MLESPSRPQTPLAFALLVWLSLSTWAAPAAADITYHYDELGRLRAVVDPASDTRAAQVSSRVDK